jgi:hypothetical protein
MLIPILSHASPIVKQYRRLGCCAFNTEDPISKDLLNPVSNKVVTFDSGCFHPTYYFAWIM